MDYCLERYESFKPLLFGLIIAILLRIVNIGKILTDRINERKYLKGKYNERYYYPMFLMVSFLFTCPKSMEPIK